jgi:Sporulation and spore germination
MLEPTTVELDLSADAEKRAKQLITALIEKTPSQTQRTLPTDAVLLQFYLMPDGTGIADFSEALETDTPSGILNEEMAVDSIVRTLGANLSDVYRLKILIRGQEADTLAGHLDLSGFFNVTPQAQTQPAAAGIATDEQPVAASPSPETSSPAQQPTRN